MDATRPTEELALPKKRTLLEVLFMFVLMLLLMPEFVLHFFYF